jgi:hypothetical protein
MTVAQVIQEQARQIGLEITINEMEAAALTALTAFKTAGHEAMVYGLGWNSCGDDARRPYYAGSNTNKATITNHTSWTCLILRSASLTTPSARNVQGNPGNQPRAGVYIRCTLLSKRRRHQEPRRRNLGSAPLARLHLRLCDRINDRRGRRAAAAQTESPDRGSPFEKDRLPRPFRRYICTITSSKEC